MNERLAIVGSGAIACGLAATACAHGEVLLVARSEESAERARAEVSRLCGRLDGADADRVRLATEHHELAGSTFVVEAVVEDHDVKAEVIADFTDAASEQAIVATTTSSLSIEALAQDTGHADRFVGLHVFNPVPRMKLVELVFPAGASASTRERARALCEALGKTAVEVPDVPGFVVNRLLFPYLFSAVRLQQETGLDAESIDRCMTLGTGHPMGPLALLDLVGLDVAQAIGETIGEPIPEALTDRVAQGRLGRKTGAGFHAYPAKGS